MIAAVFLLISITTAIQVEDLCIGLLGCVPAVIGSVVKQALLPPPMSPEKINTRLLLYTREHYTTYEAIDPTNVSMIPESSFSPEKNSTFIIHGYNSEGDKAWLSTMCQAILDVEDVNCFCVDWKNGAKTIYLQAASNIRTVGEELADFVRSLGDAYGYDTARVHLIGHSLGAHVAGHAGQKCPGIRRISGIDPAGPLFQGTDTDQKLDPSDAQLVDVISTDASSFIAHLGFGGYGTSDESGHLNFYPNGGKKQPGCEDSPFFYLRHLYEVFDIASCNHVRSYQLYTESIRDPAAFQSIPAPSYEDFENGAGFPCFNGSCARMGYYADLYTLSSRKFYLNTRGEPPYTEWRTRATINVTANSSTEGSVSLSLHHSSEVTPKYEVYSGDIVTGTYSRFLDVCIPGPLSAVTVTWSLSDPIAVKASSVTVEYGHDAQEYSFCAQDPEVGDSSVTLHPCV